MSIKALSLLLGVLMMLSLFSLVVTVNADLGAGTWKTETVDNGSWPGVGYYTSIAIDANGYPHISYHDEGHGYLKYAHKTSTGWYNDTVDIYGGVGSYSSLALDAYGNPHISYHKDAPNSYAIKYAYRGTVWTKLTVDSVGAVGTDTSIALDANGYAHFSYLDHTNNRIKYIYRDGAGWHNETVVSFYSVFQGKFTSIAVDASGYPRISYYDYGKGDLGYAWKDSSGTWKTTTVDSAGAVGGYSSLALDTNGNPRISYYDETNSSLKYAWKDTMGWHNVTVDDTGAVGEYTSLELDANGYPHISYYDGTFGNHDLKYAWKDTMGWHNTTVDSARDVGKYTSLALDAYGNPHISYYDETNYDLKYAYWTPGTGLTIATTTASPTTNVAFTLSGTLKWGTTPLPSQPVHLEKRTGTTGTWANVANTYKKTNSTGKVSVSQTVTTAGTYQYRWHFNGTATYAAAYSPTVTETVRKPTTFAITTSTTTPTTNVAFTLSGTLKSGTTPLTSKPVHLERRTGTTGTWANVAGTSKYTNAIGVIKLSQTVATAGTFQFRWHYNGTSTYQPAYSAAVTETVKKPSTLTISTSTTAPKLNVAFTVKGTLKSGTTGLVGYSVHLERKIGTRAWGDVTGTTKTTGTGGAIPSVSQTMTTHTTYSYRWHFAGTSSYKLCYSPVKTFTV